MSQYDEELVSQFTDVTGVDNEQARFYLESAAWQLELALVSFYENENENDRQQNANVEEDNEVQEISASDAPTVTKPGKMETTSGKTVSKGGIINSKFATLSSLSKDPASSDEEEGQAFYAGGSENSGQQVLGPGKKKNSIVSQMFKSAQEHGAEVVDPHQPSDSKKKSTFTGVGYRLGQSNNDSEVIGPPGGASSSTKKEVNVTLKMWHDGFSINEGPLRRYSDPDTREFLSAVGRGEIPDELLKEAQGNEVHLNMEDHSHEEFVPVKPKLKVFSGKGNVLGRLFCFGVALTDLVVNEEQARYTFASCNCSPTPNTIMDPSSTTSEQDKTNNEDKARQILKVNASEPTTTIQIRLADGSRLAATLNHTHTIADLREYIKTARPEYCNRRFNLMTTFPNKELEDDKTLVDAGILNSAIMQRLT